MKLNHRVFKSEPSESGPKGPRFANQEWIQDSLASICEAWFQFLKDYLIRTEAIFLNRIEPPWKEHEGTIVSTLLGAVIRKFPESIALEQCEVEKPGIGKNENARKKTDRGLSDLWVSIPKSKDEDLDFNFYLEAKRATSELTIARLPDYLREWYGISKIFRDYQKGTLGKLDQRRRFKQPWGRNHDHFAVGLSVIPLKASENSIDEIEKIIREAFECTLWLKLKSKTESDKARILKRFPTVALIVVDEEPSSKSRYPGMVAIFTVLGSTQKFARKNTISSDKPDEIE